jgi:hypothetical protein
MLHPKPCDEVDLSGPGIPEIVLWTRVLTNAVQDAERFCVAYKLQTGNNYRPSGHTLAQIEELKVWVSEYDPDQVGSCAWICQEIAPDPIGLQARIRRVVLRMFESLG